jgi:hypothetical protein
VSNATLALEYIQTVEMKRAIERHAAGEAVLVAVILEQCVWKKTPLAKWQAILPNGRPVLESRPQTNGWAVVAEELHNVFERLRREHGVGKR